jgi:hypothetical protein
MYKPVSRAYPKEAAKAYARLEQAIVNDFFTRYGLGPDRRVEFQVWVEQIAEASWPLSVDDVVAAYEQNSIVEGWSFEKVMGTRDASGVLVSMTIRASRKE